MTKHPKSVTVRGYGCWNERFRVRRLRGHGRLLVNMTHETIHGKPWRSWVSLTPAQLRKFCEAGLKMCDQMEQGKEQDDG